MVVVVSMPLLLTQYCITRFEYLTLRLDARKIAAIVALVGSAIYLKLSLNPVSAQRAFIMSSIALCGIILDHNTSAIRAIAISALLILSTTPEELLNPSLQMSFIASISLIGSFNTEQIISILLANTP